MNYMYNGIAVSHFIQVGPNVSRGRTL